MSNRLFLNDYRPIEGGRRWTRNVTPRKALLSRKYNTLPNLRGGVIVGCVLTTCARETPSGRSAAPPPAKEMHLLLSLQDRNRREEALRRRCRAICRQQAVLASMPRSIRPTRCRQHAPPKSLRRQAVRPTTTERQAMESETAPGLWRSRRQRQRPALSSMRCPPRVRVR